MLWPRPAAVAPLVFPFEQPGLRYRYFARNAVWDAIQMLGLAGKKVLMPAYHHGVELETLLAAGVEPVFFRVDGQMRSDLRTRAQKSRGCSALYMIHYAGFPQDMVAARELASEMGVPLLEDCALALLSRDGEKPLGSFGDVSVFCLYKTPAGPERRRAARPRRLREAPGDAAGSGRAGHCLHRLAPHRQPALEPGAAQR